MSQISKSFFVVITGKYDKIHATIGVVKDSYLYRSHSCERFISEGGHDMICSVKKFSEMYETVYRDLYRYALCLMKNPQEAEDAVSEAVIAAYENIHKLKKEEAFKSWIFTILTNKCKKRLKKALKETPGREEELPEQATVPDYDLAIDVKKAFFVLSKEEQILVGLSVFGGYCSQEIGEMMRLNPNTVRSKRSRALKKMECVLGSYDEQGRRE